MNAGNLAAVRLAMLISLLSIGCVTPMQPSAVFTETAAMAPLRTMYAMTPQIVPVRGRDAYNATLQRALALGFKIGRTDALAGLLVISRLRRDEYETEIDPQGLPHVRELTFTIVLDTVSATISPSVMECIDRSCAPFDGLLESEVGVLKNLMNALDPPAVLPSSRDTTSL